MKVIEELLNAHHQQAHTDSAGRQYIVVPPESEHLFHQLNSSVGNQQGALMNNEQLTQLTQALQKVISASTPTSADVQNQTQLQESILSFLNNRIAPQQQQQQQPQQQNQDLSTRNRSLSSSMDASTNGNDSSNSTVSSTAPSPMTSHLHHSTVMLNKIKDEPQHVPSARATNSNSSIERVSLEHNEVLKKEKKRERNRQVGHVHNSFADTALTELFPCPCSRLRRSAVRVN